MKKSFVIIILSVFLFSCKEEPKQIFINGKDASKEILDVKDLKVPSSCDLLAPDFLADIFDVDKEVVNVSDGGAEEGSSGCFFRWATKTKPNAGVFVQVFTNPLQEETNNWASGMISGMMGGNSYVAGEKEGQQYVKFEGHGTDGCYNHALGRYYWRVGENYLFMLAFNLDEMTDGEKLSLANKLASEIEVNFSNKF